MVSGNSVYATRHYYFDVKHATDILFIWHILFCLSDSKKFYKGYEI